MAYVMTHIEVGDFDAWKPMFDLDAPHARQDAIGYRLFRGVDNPNEVFIEIEFATTEAAVSARDRLVRSGVLDRFDDRHGPTVVDTAEVISRRSSAAE
ncbi:MAG: hypothetical protein V7644_54 [Actinomycetota bacterium]|jgi:hypothetical protein